MATVSPGATSRLKSSIKRLVRLVAETDVLQLDRPGRSRRGARRSAGARSAASSSASRNSKTRSAEAMPDCRRFIWLAIWVIGMVNWREYWMNA